MIAYPALQTAIAPQKKQPNSDRTLPSSQISKAIAQTILAELVC
ncbi:hypothetical protein [Pseudanabaena cinerea]|jgi:hypothetical protein|nr:hypothetical protein [Pseudanabaena cinerea]